MLQSRMTEKQTEFLDITLPGAKLNNNWTYSSFNADD